ncbi:MAG: hypothetical protein NPIRA01_10780 [Nitrospirales bacterium]|nr:MAG: hypothetical protein NPIRA01_10780 [Nitrospirales bacterium]
MQQRSSRQQEFPDNSRHSDRRITKLTSLIQENKEKLTLFMIPYIFDELSAQRTQEVNKTDRKD